MRRPVGIDRASRRPQRLGDHLATEQPAAPRIASGDADVGVGPVRLQLEELAELDVVDPRRRHPHSVAADHAPGPTLA